MLLEISSDPIGLRAVIAELKVPAFPPLAEETKTMAENTGYQVAGMLIQKRKSVHHTYTIGPGRLNDLKRLVEDNDGDTVIFANTAVASPENEPLSLLAIYSFEVPWDWRVSTL